MFLKKLIFTIFSLSILSTGIVISSSPMTAYASAESCKKTVLGLPVWYQYLDLDADCNITGPLATNPDGTTAGFDWARGAGYVAIAVVEILMRLASLVAVGFVVYGGFKYITSQGEPESTKDARNTILNAVIGLVVTMIAATLINFLTTRLTT